MPAPTTPVLLHNGLLIDGTGADPVRDGSLLIEDGRVRWAGPSADCPVPAEGTRRIDVRGGTILPGFIDCHVHMAAPGTALSHAEIATMPRSLLTFLAAPRMRQTLEAGVTTARDLGGADAGHRRAVESGLLVGPRLLVAVAMLSPTGGHGDFRAGNDDRANDNTMGRLADGTSECRRAVRGVLRQGADCVKIAATGGVWSPTDQPDDDGFLEDEIRTITKIAAGHRGKKVAAHAQGRGGILNAVRGGVASVEHGYEIDDEAIDLMLERGTFLVPTLTTAHTDPDPKKAAPWAYAKKKHWQEVARRHIPHAIERGVRVAMGTDCGIAEHGTNLRELGHLVDCGMTPMGALRAGTAEAAELLGIAHETGTLEPGKRADVVIARGNPLDDIHALGDPGNILVVMKDGVVYKDADGLAA
ncbi:amidohydrolase family protein [Streptomyces sp. NBC_01260]|uniref:metal-dependent hydrolase family protein n=1 Tax=unclassified Streptomyces TaxID=2593676 RepID=UPI000F4A60D8|nr:MULTISPECIES: amidohydrolase family protein [unclassified Streptomyces]MCX4774302.1 amidohydrolase family protein [Streptomyces sp. NBC_01285]ROQ73235.1 imidazolonepropionase-like amidohydrolase [Streptomyces sp. CEV 2-1]RPK36398.1 imidazolonepropionase [Streptomyces sp. ADI92-24]